MVLLNMDRPRWVLLFLALVVAAQAIAEEHGESSFPLEEDGFMFAQSEKQMKEKCQTADQFSKKQKSNIYSQLRKRLNSARKLRLAYYMSVSRYVAEAAEKIMKDFFKCQQSVIDSVLSEMWDDLKLKHKKKGQHFKVYFISAVSYFSPLSLIAVDPIRQLEVKADKRAHELVHGKQTGKTPMPTPQPYVAPGDAGDYMRKRELGPVYDFAESDSKEKAKAYLKYRKIVTGMFDKGMYLLGKGLKAGFKSKKCSIENLKAVFFSDKRKFPSYKNLKDSKTESFWKKSGVPTTEHGWGAFLAEHAAAMAGEDKKRAREMLAAIPQTCHSDNSLSYCKIVPLSSCWSDIMKKQGEKFIEKMKPCSPSFCWFNPSSMCYAYNDFAASKAFPEWSWNFPFAKGARNDPLRNYRVAQCKDAKFMTLDRCPVDCAANKYPSSLRKSATVCNKLTSVNKSKFETNILASRFNKEICKASFYEEDDFQQTPEIFEEVEDVDEEEDDKSFDKRDRTAILRQNGHDATCFKPDGTAKVLPCTECFGPRMVASDACIADFGSWESKARGSNDMKSLFSFEQHSLQKRDFFSFTQSRNSKIVQLCPAHQGIWVRDGACGRGTHQINFNTKVRLNMSKAKMVQCDGKWYDFAPIHNTDSWVVVRESEGEQKTFWKYCMSQNFFSYTDIKRKSSSSSLTTSPSTTTSRPSPTPKQQPPPKRGQRHCCRCA